MVIESSYLITSKSPQELHDHSPENLSSRLSRSSFTLTFQSLRLTSQSLRFTLQPLHIIS